MGTRDGEGLVGADSTEPDSNIASPPPSLAIAQTSATQDFSRAETSAGNRPREVDNTYGSSPPGRHQPSEHSTPTREDVSRGPVMHSGPTEDPAHNTSYSWVPEMQSGSHPLQHDDSMIPDEHRRDAILQKAPGTSPETTGYSGVM